MPAPTRLRNTMSAVTITTMASRISAAAIASASNSRPKDTERRVTRCSCGCRRDYMFGHCASPSPGGGGGEPAARSESIPRQLPQLRPALRRALDDGLPGHVVGLVEKRLRRRRAEVERLDAGGGLALALGLDDGDFFAVERFEPERRVVEHLALRVVELFPGVEVDEHVDLHAVERRLHAEFRHLLPAEIENAGDRPAVAIDHAALERGVDLARRRGDRRTAERLDHVLVDRRDPD